ncbi:hypothetical protein F4604DRAFT_1677112 [Suillus subluteus]|nr:hypothetical protein F4604DRAFT_1677112 [Suillus subluteus]
MFKWECGNLRPRLYNASSETRRIPDDELTKKEVERLTVQVLTHVVEDKAMHNQWQVHYIFEKSQVNYRLSFDRHRADESASYRYQPRADSHYNTREPGPLRGTAVHDPFKVIIVAPNSYRNVTSNRTRKHAENNIVIKASRVGVRTVLQLSSSKVTVEDITKNDLGLVALRGPFQFTNLDCPCPPHRFTCIILDDINAKSDFVSSWPSIDVLMHGIGFE